MFRKKRSNEWVAVVQREPVDYPTGSVVRSSNGTYFIKGKFMYRIPTPRVLESWRFASIAAATPGALEKFTYGGKLGFRDGTLIKDLSTGKSYLISAAKKRLITDPDAFDKYGLNRATCIEVSADEASLHDDGEELK